MSACKSPGSTSEDTTSIADALTRGGIDDCLSRNDLLALIRGLVDADPGIGNGTGGAASLLGKLTDGTLEPGRESNVAIVDDRVAMLGFDRPIEWPTTPPALRLMFLDPPLPVAGSRPAIDTLLLLIGSPTAAHSGLRQKLLTLLNLPTFRELLSRPTTGATLVDSVRKIESSLAAATD